MRDSRRTRALERAWILFTAAIAAACMYVLTGNAGLAIGIAALATVIAVVLDRLESLAGCGLGLLLLPLELLLRLVTGRPRRR